MMNWAVTTSTSIGHPSDAAPSPSSKAPRGPSPTPAASEDEETRLLAAAPPTMRPMIICALDTGMRRGEMLALRFGDVDLKLGLHCAARRDDEEPQDPASFQSQRHVFAACSNGCGWTRWASRNQTRRRSSAMAPERRSRSFSDLARDRPEGPRLHPRWSRKNDYKGLTRESQEAFQRSTCTGTTSVTSTPHASSKRVCHWPRCATCSDTHQSRPLSATTTRGSRTCKPRQPSSNAVRCSTVRTTPMIDRGRGESFKFLSSLRDRNGVRTPLKTCLQSSLTS